MKPHMNVFDIHGDIEEDGKYCIELPNEFVKKYINERVDIIYKSLRCHGTCLKIEKEIKHNDNIYLFDALNDLSYTKVYFNIDEKDIDYILKNNKKNISIILPSNMYDIENEIYTRTGFNTYFKSKIFKNMLTFHVEFTNINFILRSWFVKTNEGIINENIDETNYKINYITTNSAKKFSKLKTNHDSFYCLDNIPFKKRYNEKNKKIEFILKPKNVISEYDNYDSFEALKSKVYNEFFKNGGLKI